MEELILQHENMIASIIHKLNYVSSDISYDELMQVGRLSIWRTAHKHDPEKGKLSTFLYTCIQRDIWKYLDKEGKHKHVSLDTVLDTHVSDDVQDKVEENILIERVRQEFGDNADYFIERYMRGHTVPEIAESYGVTTKKVTYWSNKIYGYIKEDYHEEED